MSSMLCSKNHITARHFNLHLLEKADLVIRPDVGLVHWSEFKLLRLMVEEGENATEKAIPEIRQLINKKTGKLSKLLRQLTRVDSEN